MSELKISALIMRESMLFSEEIYTTLAKILQNCRRRTRVTFFRNNHNYNLIKIWVSQTSSCHFLLSLKGLPLSLSFQNFKLTFSTAIWKSMSGKGEVPLNPHLCFSYYHQKWNPKSHFWILCKRRKRGTLLETIWGVFGGKLINIWCASNNKELLTR